MLTVYWNCVTAIILLKILAKFYKKNVLISYSIFVKVSIKKRKTCTVINIPYHSTLIYIPEYIKQKTCKACNGLKARNIRQRSNPFQ